MNPFESVSKQRQLADVNEGAAATALAAVRRGASAGEALDMMTRGDTLRAKAVGAGVQMAVKTIKHPLAQIAAPVAGHAATYATDKAIRGWRRIRSRR